MRELFTLILVFIILTSPSSATEELCNFIDDDGDGQIDEGFDIGKPCYVGRGECKTEGTYICDEDDGTDNVCDAKPGKPSDELCDGLDNDCDGKVDEDFNLGEPCTVGVGVCEKEGHYICSKEKTDAICNAEPGTPSDEICDGLDNDCDGKVDEEGICNIQELCNGIDDDNDGQIDEDFDTGQPCDSDDSDSCMNGVYTCKTDGSGVECINEHPKDIIESCNGVDDDCDGIVDNILEKGQACDGPDSDSCENGITACKPGGGIGCFNETIEDIKEICDQVDNDCDGQIDEDNACVILRTPPPDEPGVITRIINVVSRTINNIIDYITRIFVDPCNGVVCPPSIVDCPDGSQAICENTCSNGKCSSCHAECPVDCDDGDPCTTDSYDSLTGQCGHTPKDCTTQPGSTITATGTPKPDIPETGSWHQDIQILRGTANDDLLTGGTSNDRIMGLAGNDILTGGEGEDLLEGGQGNDLIEGGPGPDILSGGDGDDIIDGDNEDFIDGGAGLDTLRAGNLENLDKVSKIELIELAGSLVLYKTRVISLGGSNSAGALTANANIDFFVKGTGTVSFLESDWNPSGSVVYDGITYDLYENTLGGSDAVVAIQQGMDVKLGNTPTP